MNIPKRKLRLDLIVIVLWLFVLLLLAWRVEAQTIVDWKPIGNGTVAVTWGLDHEQTTQKITTHSIRFEGLLSVPLETAEAQAERDHVWIFWFNDGAGLYIYEVVPEPIPQGGARPQWMGMHALGDREQGNR